MRLKEILSGIEYNSNCSNLEISGLFSDSRKVIKNGLFFAIKGEKLNGEDFVLDAVKNGACAIVVTKKLNVNVEQIIVKDIRKVLSVAVKNFYNINKIKLIGVVGTNGKTSITFILKSVLEENKNKVGVIGTTGIYYENVFIEPELTTPDAIELGMVLSDMQKRGIEYCVMELSAHAITLKRAYAFYFEQIIFTNLSQDHLDYYKNLEDYKNAKLSVFEEKFSKSFIVNADDDLGVKILNKQLKNTFSYGIYNPSDVFAIDIKTKPNSTTYVVNAFDKIKFINQQLIGEFNVYNVLAVITSSMALGVDISVIHKAVEKIKGVKGRLEFVEEYNGSKIFVDYAHTPDGLKKVLETLKSITKNRLIVLFGCGGDRDREKRKIMGEIAGEIADFTIITSDNPRYEDPYSIIREIEKGVREKSFKYITIQNRYDATGYALKQLVRGDILLLAGKGAEEYQEIMGIKSRYNDKEKIQELIAKLNFCGEVF